MSESPPATPATPGPSRGVVVVGMLITFMGGYLLGSLGKGRSSEDGLSEARDSKRVQVPVGFSPSKGRDDALVTIVEFADFECPFCSRSIGLQRRVLSEFPGTVRWVFKQFPLNFHHSARPAARAALAAHAQGQFWPYHDRLFGQQSRLGQEDLLKLAHELGLDMARFRTELDGRVIDRLVSEDMELGGKVGVQGTPSFYVNGRELVGAGYEALGRMIRQELAWAAELLRRGVPRAQIYEEITKAAPASPPASRPAGSEGQAARP